MRPEINIDAELQRKGYRAFTVDHEPAPFVRATKKEIGMAGRGRGGKADAIARYFAFKEAVGRAYQSAYPGAGWIEGQVSLAVVIFWPAGRYRRFDLVNVFKAAEDALNKVAFKDDQQVTHGRFWAEEVPNLAEAYVGVVVGPAIPARGKGA